MCTESTKKILCNRTFSILTLGHKFKSQTKFFTTVLLYSFYYYKTETICRTNNYCQKNGFESECLQLTRIWWSSTCNGLEWVKGWNFLGGIWWAQVWGFEMLIRRRLNGFCGILGQVHREREWRHPSRFTLKTNNFWKDDYKSPHVVEPPG